MFLKLILKNLTVFLDISFTLDLVSEPYWIANVGKLTLIAISK